MTPPPPPVTELTVTSAARGADVRLIVVRPEGTPSAALPVCLALHGRGSDASMFADLGLAARLTEAVRAGAPPFAVVSVDGGDSYWQARVPSDDPQRMLDEEMPAWLAGQGLEPDPVGAMGISMGAFGSLNYARRHRDRLRAVAAISPALFLSWGDADTRKAFADRAQWEAMEPLRHAAEFRGPALGVWCGTADPFEPAARELVAVATPEVAEFGPGAHDHDFWARVLPDVLRFVGSRL